MKFINIFTRQSGVLLCMPLLVALLISGTASAEETVEATQPLTAHQVLETTTQQLMLVITEAQQYYDTDPERFYREIESLLNDVVDFDGFARGVMGKYASKKAYQALGSAEEKQAFKARMSRFSEIFKEGLVKTYAKGLLAFNGNRIDVLPPEAGAPVDGSVTVVQHIYGEAATPYVVSYKMRQDKSAQWKLRNLTIEAINLGIIYRSQFYSAAKRYSGDVDQVIDGWSVDPSGK